MTQTRRDPEFCREFGRRLEVLVENHLSLSWRELALALGYETDSAIRQVRNGQALPSAEKLAALARLEACEGGGRISIEWLLTGNGMPVHPTAGTNRPLSNIAVRVQCASEDAQQTIAAYLDVRNAAKH